MLRKQNHVISIFSTDLHLKGFVGHGIIGSYHTVRNLSVLSTGYFMPSNVQRSSLTDPFNVVLQQIMLMSIAWLYLDWQVSRSDETGLGTRKQATYINLLFCCWWSVTSDKINDGRKKKGPHLFLPRCNVNYCREKKQSTTKLPTAFPLDTHFKKSRLGDLRFIKVDDEESNNN